MKSEKLQALKEKMVKSRQKIIWTLISVTCLLLLWQYGAMNITGRVKLPLPVSVFKEFFISMKEPIGRYTLLTHISISLYRVALGLAVSTVMGIIIGIGMGYSRIMEAIVKPVFEFFRPIPPLAWIPLSILWFGLGSANKVFIIFLGSFPYITINSYYGARNADPILIGAAKMLGANRFQIFTHVILPSSVPDIFAGLQVAITSSWSAVVAAEIIHSEEGAGWIITMGMNNGNTVRILVGMIAIGIVGFLLSSIMQNIERRLCAWNRKQA